MGRFAQENNEVELKDDEHKVDWEKEHLCVTFVLITTGIY